MKKKVLGMIVMIMVVAMMFGMSSVYAKEKEGTGLKEYDEITPETYAEMEHATEADLLTYLSIPYTYRYERLNEEVYVKPKPILDWEKVNAPAIILYEKRPTLVFINGEGRLMYLPIGEYVTDAKMAYETPHCMINEGEELIRSGDIAAYKYIKAKGEIEAWSNNFHHFTYHVPQNSEYCGFSKNVGFLFRSGTDVYTYTNISRFSRVFLTETILIAHDVREVITSNYDYDEENLNTPLFFMEDGSLKAYVVDIDDIDREQAKKTEFDSEKYLKTPKYEGGYQKSVNH